MHQKHHPSSRDNPRSKPRRPPNINTSLAAARTASKPPPEIVTPPSSVLFIPEREKYQHRQQHQHQQLSRPQSQQHPRRRTSDTHLRPADESFLDNATPVDADVDAQGNMAEHHASSRVSQRDSHDLSYSTRNVTRDSLVTNMLLSLDQFSSMGSGPTGTSNSNDSYDDAPQLFDTSRSWANSVVPNTRHQPTYSSDLDANDDGSRMSGQTSRGRRSNSSSNFHNTYTRLNSVREAGHRSQPSTPRVGRHSRGGKESKSSSTASVDAAYSQLQQQQRLARGTGRSASFDHGPSSQLDSVPSSPFQVDFSNNYREDYDAAPTPTIPSGPRRVPSTPAMPPPPPPEPKQHMERKRSISRSIKSSSGRRGLSSRDAAPAAPAPALVSPELDSAPAPNVGYGKSKDALQNGGQPAPKEKQGFFRRVFGGGGSSKNVDAQAQQSRVTSPPDRPHDSGGNNSSAPPSRDDSSSHSQRPTLQKKPSSFFRRRKKSTAEQAPPLPSDAPPVPPVAPINLHVEKGKNSDKNPSSPVSSLREVMTPYLDKYPQRDLPLRDITNMTPDRRTESSAEYKREFSPDYEPSPNARIRTVQPDSDHDRTSSAHETPTRPAPGRPGQSQTRSDSFLNLDNGSDGDEETGRGTMKASKSKRVADLANEDTLRPKKGSAPVYQTDSEEETGKSKLALPIEGARAMSPVSASSHADSRPATSATPSVHIEAPAEPSPKKLNSKASATLRKSSKPLDEPKFVIGEPTEDDRQKAQKIFDGNEDFIAKEKAASWMGEEGPVRQRTLQAYMELYDFTNQSIVSALRQVCGRLVFRAETQQVDRILVAFSKQWCHSNPNHGFKATDVIHMICYSIMLLNTDLHLADIEQKMTRSQFVKNTMTTISQAVKDAAPDAFSARTSILPEKSNGLSADAPAEPETRSFRHSFRPPPRTDTQNSAASDLTNDSGPLVKAPFEGSFRAWEEQVENVLKGTYASIRDERLPLYGAEPEAPPMPPMQSGSLSVMGILKRSPSVLSKAPSESAMSMRGRGPENGRAAAARWTSKSRSRPGMGRNGFNSSRTSFDEANSMWSPALSSATWSKYSLGRTHTSVSQDSFAVSMHRSDYQQSIGFANALSQAVIRNDDLLGRDGAQSVMSEELPDQILDDESLELSGPPWVKEGMVIHKHHLDGVEKKARDRNWTEVFAVIQRGQMSLFSFSANKSMRQKNRTRNASKMNAPVGGGNWQDNATNMGSFNLRQTLASALPSPGYSRTRPHVWALSLPTGAVHLFQVGTPEIIKEFVNTVNYWSARLSTHPLVGGISNIEYGWGENIVNNSLVMAINESSGTSSGNTGKDSRPGSSAAVGRRSSFQSGRASIRSASIDLGARAFNTDSGRGKLPGDRIHIAAWAPPTQSMRPSNAREEEQLAILSAYVKNIEEDLQAHNQLRSPMLLAFTPRGSNANKAMSNWERKSAYLLREIVKYRTYVDCLQQAGARRQEVYGERRLARKAAKGELSDGEMEASGDEQELKA